MFIKSDGRRLLQDSPIERARREAEAKAKTSLRSQLRERHAEQDADMAQRHAKAGREMSNRHAVEKGRDSTMHGHLADNIGPRKALADKHAKERADLTAEQRQERKALDEKQQAELHRADKSPFRD